jgi:hypothetical protein
MRKTGDSTPMRPECSDGATDCLIVFGRWVVREIYWSMKGERGASAPRFLPK